MKKLYIAHHETTVWGISFLSDDDAEKNAIDFLKSEGYENLYLDGVEELEVPDTADEENFNSCASVNDYIKTAKYLLSREKS